MTEGKSVNKEPIEVRTRTKCFKDLVESLNLKTGR